MDTDLDRFKENFRVENRKEFGSLTVFHIIPKEDAVEAEEQEFKEKVITSSDLGTPDKPRRYRWNEIFKEKDYYYEEVIE